jgi:tRNA dimethylallyltransferase
MESNATKKEKIKVLCLTGPTGVGKTRIALKLAERFHLEIINGDAFQIYQNMNIGTAKPTAEEQARVPHHYFDVISSKEYYSVFDYQKGVRETIEKVNQKNELPFLVGGSGLYLDSVLFDYQFTENKRSDEFEKRYLAVSNEELKSILDKQNKTVSDKIPVQNRKRLLRALEIIETNPNPTIHKNVEMYDSLLLVLTDNREVLYERINKRVDQMMEQGLLEEVKSLYPNQFSKTSKEAIGYKQLIEYLENEVSLDDAIDNIKKASRHYAKRQLTWYRNHPGTVIYSIENKSFEETISELEKLILDWNPNLK